MPGMGQFFINSSRPGPIFPGLHWGDKMNRGICDAYIDGLVEDCWHTGDTVVLHEAIDMCF